VGGRHCSLPDGSRAAHLYYVGHHGSHLSALVLDRNVRLGDGHSVRSAGSVVHLMRAARMTVGIVSEERDPVEAFRRALFTMAARGPDRRRGGSPRNPRSAVALPLELLTVGGPSDIFAVSAVGL